MLASAELSCSARPFVPGQQSLHLWLHFDHVSGQRTKRGKAKWVWRYARGGPNISMNWGRCFDERICKGGAIG